MSAKRVSFGLQEDGSIRLALTLDASTWERWCASFEVGDPDVARQVLTVLRVVLAVGDQHLEICRELLLGAIGGSPEDRVNLNAALDFQLAAALYSEPVEVGSAADVLH